LVGDLHVCRRPLAVRASPLLENRAQLELFVAANEPAQPQERGRAFAARMTADAERVLGELGDARASNISSLVRAVGNEQSLV
jgi:hypothetical protein